MATFEKGQRVFAKGRAGTVAYQRLGAPDYSSAEAVSVVLDHRRNDPAYAGSMFAASDVIGADEAGDRVTFEVRTGRGTLEGVFPTREAAQRYIGSLREGCGVTDAKICEVFHVGH